MCVCLRESYMLVLRGHVACMGKGEMLEFWRRKLQYSWEDSAEMDLKQVGWENVDWVNLAQDRNQW